MTCNDKVADWVLRTGKLSQRCNAENSSSTPIQANVLDGAWTRSLLADDSIFSVQSIDQPMQGLMGGEVAGELLPAEASEHLRKS